MYCRALRRLKTCTRFKKINRRVYRVNRLWLPTTKCRGSKTSIMIEFRKINSWNVRHDRYDVQNRNYNTNCIIRVFDECFFFRRKFYANTKYVSEFGLFSFPWTRTIGNNDRPNGEQSETGLSNATRDDYRLRRRTGPNKRSSRTRRFCSVRSKRGSRPFFPFPGCTSCPAVNGRIKRPREIFGFPDDAAGRNETGTTGAGGNIYTTVENSSGNPSGTRP